MTLPCERWIEEYNYWCYDGWQTSVERTVCKGGWVRIYGHKFQLAAQGIEYDGSLDGTQRTFTLYPAFRCKDKVWYAPYVCCADDDVAWVWWPMDDEEDE